MEEQNRVKEPDLELYADSAVANDAARRKQKKKNRLVKEILIDSISILLALFVACMIVKFVGQRTVVDGSSMEPTLSNNDNLIVDKISYRIHDPERFDVIVFQYQYEKNTFYVKRVIGLPGETVRIDEEGNIYINEVLLEENYGREQMLDPGLAYNGFTLGEDEYFVLGDNRNHSSDSRTISVAGVNRDTIVGKVWVRIYPFNKIGSVQ